jgi:hypothetical protein
LDEWRRGKAIRRLLWVAIGLVVFPGSQFVALYLLVHGPSVEILVALYPAAVMGALAWALHAFEPERPAAQVRWKPEEELLTPVPRPVEARWSTPRATLPLLLSLFPIIYLLAVVTEGRDLRWDALTALLAAILWSVARAQGRDRQLVQTGAVVQGLVRRIIAGQGTFRLKIAYEFGGQEFFAWSPNLSPTSWFGPLMVEERRYVTLLVDPAEPDRFVVYPFCGLQVEAA